MHVGQNCYTNKILIIPDDLSIQNPPPFNHAGGCQVCDNYLAFGMEITSNKAQSQSRVVIIDISDTQQPQHLNHLDISRSAGQDGYDSQTAGAVALVKLSSCYLLAVANYNAWTIDFYTSTSLDLQDSNTSFVKSGSAKGPENGWQYQNINLFVDSSTDGGKVWMVGMYAELLQNTDNYADLFEVNVSSLQNITLGEPSASNPFDFVTSSGHARFLYGSGVYRDTATDSLTMYCCEANINDGASRCYRWPANNN